jgi:hypothetical protein
MRKDLLELAEKENISKWQSVIALWIEQHQEQKVSGVATTASTRYAIGRSLARITAFPHTLSVGW